MYMASVSLNCRKKKALGTVLFSDNQKHQVTVHKTRSILDRMFLNSDAVSEENCSIVSGNWPTRQGTLHGVWSTRNKWELLAGVQAS